MTVNHFNVDIPVFCDLCEKKIDEIKDVQLHGGFRHSMYIAIVKYILWKRKIKTKNTEIFSNMYKSPGIPDVYAEYTEKGKDDYGRTRTITKSVCIEIETNPTPGGNEDKYAQFFRPGMREPIILDMGPGFEKYKDERRKEGSTADDLELAYAYIDRNMVF
jgi:hypothetical protein